MEKEKRVWLISRLELAGLTLLFYVMAFSWEVWVPIGLIFVIAFVLDYRNLDSILLVEELNKICKESPELLPGICVIFSPDRRRKKGGKSENYY